MKQVMSLLVVAALVGCDTSPGVESIESIRPLGETPGVCDREIKDPMRVSLVTLIANPQKYYGKAVLVQGFYRNSFEHSAIYLHRDDADHFITQNGFWVSGAVPESLSDRYITISGIFNSSSNGHLGQWPATLCRASVGAGS